VNASQEMEPVKVNWTTVCFAVI